jgi:hypothetical protein
LEQSKVIIIFTPYLGEQMKVLLLFGFRRVLQRPRFLNLSVMQDPKEKPQVSIRKPKIIQELQPNKICKCGACEPSKPKLPKGMRRLKVYYKAGCTETIPVILLQGEWIRNLGLMLKTMLLFQKRKLIINLETE